MLGGQPKQTVEELDLGLDSTCWNLSLPDHLHRLVASQGSPGGLEGEESQPCFDQTFDEPMVLFDHIVQIFDWSELASLGQLALSLELIYRLGISQVPVYVDHPRSDGVAGTQHFGEEPFGSLGISVLTKQELQGAACRVHRPVQVQPLSLDLYVGLIYSPRVVGPLQMGLAALL